MLAYFYQGAPTEVIAGSSPVGLGTVLVQKVDGERRVVCFASIRLFGTVKLVKEALALRFFGLAKDLISTCMVYPYRYGEMMVKLFLLEILT